jgi:hypothetical protein
MKSIINKNAEMNGKNNLLAILPVAMTKPKGFLLALMIKGSL